MWFLKLKMPVIYMILKTLAQMALTAFALLGAGSVFFLLWWMIRRKFS